MKTYKVTYSGNASRFQDFESEVNANSQREAVEKVFASVLDSNYFPQKDGSVLDCDGEIVAEDSNDVYFMYDGGSFYAEEIEE